MNFFSVCSPSCLSVLRVSLMRKDDCCMSNGLRAVHNFLYYSMHKGPFSFLFFLVCLRFVLSRAFRGVLQG